MAGALLHSPRGNLSTIDMQIRSLGSEDREAYRQLVHAVFPDPAPHNDPLATLDRLVAAEGGEVLIAVVDGCVVGTVIGGYDGVRGWVYSLAVAEPYRRRGVGTALMKELQARLGELGCVKINLQVRAESADVVRFYESIGFQIEDRISMGRRL